MFMQIKENSPTVPASPALFSVTTAAAERINHLKRKHTDSSLRFRILVKGGGCSGFQYEFALDGKPAAEDDHVFTHEGAEVVIDDVSLGFIRGSVLDYSEDLSQAGFEIRNPKATASCGCGNSFSVAL